MIDSNDGRRELVVLVHGFGAKRALMWPLATRIRANGFRVLNWNYLSLFAAIETHANRLCDFLATQLSMEPCFHIVAHSMGSIVTRAALNRSSLSNFGRLVLLAPPNAGSPAARLASFFISRVITPTRELSDQAPHRVPGTDPDPSLLASIHAATGAWYRSSPQFASIQPRRHRCLAPVQTPVCEHPSTPQRVPGTDLAPRFRRCPPVLGYRQLEVPG